VCGFFKFFFFWWYWGLNLGPHAFWESTLHLSHASAYPPTPNVLILFTGELSRSYAFPKKEQVCEACGQFVCLEWYYREASNIFLLLFCFGGVWIHGFTCKAGILPIEPHLQSEPLKLYEHGLLELVEFPGFANTWGLIPSYMVHFQELIVFSLLGG
jgi:hypothetical protein